MAKQNKVNKKHIGGRSTGNAIKKTKSVQKPVSKSKLKHQSKSTKEKINRLNANMAEYNEVKDSLMNMEKPAPVKYALDAKDLQADLKKDEEIKAQNKLVESDISKQLELITGMGL
ncbi:uncharacterized protein AC631_00048 [Debaryomyces fabryi]|uniref:Uncharacterized protein n=1 Tax=Debaryomyces fabryi TaxID=58627 RepID=A0A0V1Q6M7_9ASCO|nr:uncharacterized protein AC631_00048 [Debaryomyces fabryi]KSA04177.1 hypothetical protein AC631_00048 [Debaryomyces fabryi]CUM46234.1 unnamed protein product [Debaryomyces fabryi]